MFFCPTDSGSFSKADILRGIITEKLSIATRDILAVVERTVADYEEEASGFRRRIARQERQLELLQPQVHLRRRLVEPEPRGHEEPVGTEQPKEEVLSLRPLGIEDFVRLNFPHKKDDDDEDYDDDDDGAFDDEDEQLAEQVQPSAGSRKSEDPDFEISCRPQRRTVRPSKAWTKRSPTHLDLRIRFITDPNLDVLHSSVLKNTVVRDLSFPQSLQESEFVDLLRSSFPPLAGSHKAFEIFTLNRSKRLQKLPLKTMDPIEIIRSMKSNAPGATVLFIKLKRAEAEKTSEETSEEKLEGTSEEMKEKSEEIMEKSEEIMEKSEEIMEKSEEEKEDNPEEVNGEEIEDSHIPTVEDSPSSCDAVPEEEDEAGPSSSSGPHGFREEAGSKDSPEHHRDSKVDDMDQDDPSAEDPEWNLESEEQKEGKKAANKSGGGRLKKRDCKVCGCWYKSLGSLIKHMWTHMEEPQRVCGVCGETFESPEELKEHLRTYDKVHKCEECGKSFINIRIFNQHLELHSRKVDIQCDVCGKKFGTKSGLSLHSWSHAEERPYNCDLCDKAFGLKSLLQAHRRNHEENKCHLCRKSFSSTRSLSWHLMSHSEKRRFACDVCGKRFKNPNTLNSHKKIHMDRERSFLCHICCKTFYCNGTLKAHMMAHSGEKPFVCQDCGKGFTAKAELKKHQRVHTGERPYACSHCERRFKQKMALDSHIRSHLGIKRFACTQCGKAVSRLEHLKVHMRTHSGDRPYKCSLCDKAFTQSHCLKAHMMKFHPGENPTGP